MMMMEGDETTAAAHPSSAHNSNKRSYMDDDVAADASFLDMVETPVLELHRSNVLRIETDQLLNECSLDSLSAHHHANDAVSWSQSARTYITKVESLLHSMPPCNIKNNNSNTNEYPFPLFNNNDTSKKDLSLHVDCSSLRMGPTGSYGHGMGLTKPAGNANVVPVLDFLIRIPNSVFGNSKDFMHHVYFDKRNMLAWHVAQFLSRKKYQNVVGTVHWRHQHGDPRKVSLVLTPPHASSKRKSESAPKKKHKKNHKSTPHEQQKSKKLRFRIQLIFGMESLDWIPSPRLFPNRSNLGSSVSATPAYNHALAEDGHLESYEISQQQHHESLPKSMHQALVLAKVWCLQRGFLRGHDSFTTTSLALLLLYLYRTKHVSPRMAPLQVFTVLLKFLSETNWIGPNQTVLVMPKHDDDMTESQTIATCPQAQLYAKASRDNPINTTDGDPPTLIQCFQSFTEGPVFLDSSMRVNFLKRLSPSFMRQVQHDASRSVQCIHSSSMIRPFRYIFMESTRFWTRCDAYLTIPLNRIVRPTKTKSCLWGKDWEDVGPFESISRGIVSILSRALGDRVKSIRVFTTGNGDAALLMDGGATSTTTTANTSWMDDSDQIPTHPVRGESSKSIKTIVSPLGATTLVLGLQVNPDTAHRLVDRGPPADDAQATRAFLELWGTQKAQLRRFMDGAIVHAVVWNQSDENDNGNEDGYIRLEGDEKTQGGIVERIVRHILRSHFINNDKKKMKTKTAPGSNIQFALRNMLSMVDGVASNQKEKHHQFFSNATFAHRNIMNTFESLSDFLRRHSSPTLPIPGTTDAKTSRLGVPLAIDAVESLSPSLRYSELFPPVPHPSLGGSRAVTHGMRKISGAIMSSPIEIQIRLGPSSKWPTDLKAMGAAKTAMLIQLANGIEQMKKESTDCDGFEGPIQVTPAGMIFGYKGYSWRIVVRADPELHMLRGLKKPSPEAVSLLRALTRDHIISAMHHSTIHAVHTAHPSAGSCVRLAKLWVASHMLSDLVPFEAIELLVAKVYSDGEIPLDAPGTIVSGFLRFLKLLASHDWSRQPLVVDPLGHLSDDDRSTILAQFESVRGPNYQNGPAMYIISPNDCQGRENEKSATPSNASSSPKKKTTSGSNVLWTPSFTHTYPEWVVVSRAAALARRSHQYLMKCLVNGGNDSDGSVSNNDWSAVFQETTTSFKSYSALLRVDPDFVVDHGCSSTGGDGDCLRTSKDNNGTQLAESAYTRSMRNRYLGPKALRRRVYRNLNAEENGVLYDWDPISAMVKSLRDKFGDMCLFFYNSLTPDVVALLWRPTSFETKPFSVMNSEYKRPLSDEWESDSLMILNSQDILREMSQFTKDMVVNVKMLDDRSIPRRSASKQGGVNKRKTASSGTNNSDDESSNDSGTGSE